MTDHATLTETPVGLQTAVSGTWTVGARLVSRVIDLCTMLVLAHILHPQDFGLVAIAMTVIYILETAFELPVSQALVRLPNITKRHYDTAFTLSFIRGILLSLALCSVSYPFSLLYHDSRIQPLVCMLSLAPAARGLISPRMARYAKSLDFSREFAIELIGKVVAFCSAASIAIIFRSYWSIAIGTVAAPLVTTIASYFVASYWPSFSLAELPSFSGFLGWITVAQLISAMNWQSDRLLLGKLTSKSSLGLFTTANDVASIPLMTFFGPILRPLLSAFAIVKHDLQRLQNSYQTSCAAIVTLGLPILVGEAMIGAPAVRLLFGTRWLGAAPMLTWLAISLIPSLFAIPLGPLAMSLDKTHVFVKRNSIEFCIKLPLVVLGAIKYRFFGVIFARIVSETFTAVVCMHIVRQLIGLPIREQLSAPWRAIVSALALAGVLAFAVPWLTQDTATLPLAIGTMVCALLGAATYTTVLLSLWRIAGSPSGIESIIVNKIVEVLKRSKSPANLQLSLGQTERALEHQSDPEAISVPSSYPMSSCCIALTTDQNYLLPTLVSAITARKNCSSDIADVFVFCFGCDAETRRVFEDIFELEGIHLVCSPLDKIEQATAIMARLFLTELAPSRYQQFLYLDGDILVTGSLDPLVNVELPRGYFLAANDPLSFLAEDETRESRHFHAHLRKSGIAVETANSYFNSGVLRFDRAGWEKISERAWNLCTRERIPFRFPDQDAINLAGYENRLRMPLRWNYPIFLQNARVESIIEPRVRHFMSRPKPWQGRFAPWTSLAHAPYLAVVRKYPQLDCLLDPLSTRERIKYSLQQRMKQAVETVGWGYGKRRKRILEYERTCFPIPLDAPFPQPALRPEHFELSGDSAENLVISDLR